MRLIVAFVVVVLLAGVVVADGDVSRIFDRSAVIQALGKYGNGINEIAKLARVSCATAPGFPSDPVVRAAVQAWIPTVYAVNKVKYFRTTGDPNPAGRLNFTLGGTGFDLSLPAPPPLNTRADLVNTLVNFYSFIFSVIFTQPNHWLYSTPTVEFSVYDPEFGGPTATVIVENESRGFVCAGTSRNFQMFYGVFVHKFCYVDSYGDANDGWKICGFFEENKGAFTLPGSLYSQTIPALP